MALPENKPLRDFRDHKMCRHNICPPCPLPNKSCMIRHINHHASACILSCVENVLAMVPLCINTSG